MSPLREPLCIRLSERIAKGENVAEEEFFNRMVYDSSDGINKISLDGRLVPAVTFNESMATETDTRAKGEATDQDFDNMPESLLGTQTTTEVKAENTDEDPSTLTILGTMTHTMVELESTDEDPEKN